MAAYLGQALIAWGRPVDGAGLLDEGMAVSRPERSPVVAGIAYRSVIGARHKLSGLRRTREWTTALSYWCEAQPDLVPYRGQCLVHRSQIMQLVVDVPRSWCGVTFARIGHPDWRAA